MDHRSKILKLLEQRPILRSRDLSAEGIPRSYLSRMVKQGLIARSGRGIYVAADADYSELQSVAEVATRVPNGVMCLLTAARIHELTTEMPFEVWIAIRRSSRIPTIDFPTVRVSRFSDAAFEFGIEAHSVRGTEVKIYSAAKTVADCFKFRSRIGVDVAVEALRDCWTQKKATMDELWEAAKVCRMSNVMRPYLDTLT